MPDTLLDDNQEEIIDDNRDFYSELVGADKPYKDEKALAKAKFYADSHIKLLEKEIFDTRKDLSTEREQNDTRAKLDLLIEELKLAKLTSNKEPPVKEVEQQPAMKPEELKGLVSSSILEYENSKKEAENMSFVKAKLTERFGNNYQTKYKQQIDELGLTVEEADRMARRSPSLIVKALGLDQRQRSENFDGPVRSSVGFRPTGEAKQTYSYFRDLLKKAPREQHAKIRLQMDKVAIEQGDKFFDD